MKTTALEALQLVGLQTPETAPDTLRTIGTHETAPASLQTLAETAVKTAVTTFESLANTPPAAGRGTTYFTNPTTLENDPQSGS